MALDYDNVRLCLVNYFVKNENYKAMSKKHAEISYLLSNMNDKFNAIYIGPYKADFNTDEKFEELISSFKRTPRERVKRLYIFITDEVNKVEFKSDNVVYIYGDENSLVGRLEEYFPKAARISFTNTNDTTHGDSLIDNDIEIDESNAEEIQEQLSDTNSQVAKNLTGFVKQMRNRIPIASIFMLLLFIIIPVITVFLQTIKYQQLALTGVYTYQIFFGGMNGTLMRQGGQWWRIFTWGFASTANSLLLGILYMAFLGWLLYSVIRMWENIGKWYHVVIIVGIGYVLGGFFTGSLYFNKTFTATPLILAVSAISLFIYASRKNTVINIYARKASYLPILFLIVWPLLSGNMSTYFVILLGFVLGATCTWILLYIQSDKKDWFIAILGIMGAGLIVTPLVIFFIPSYALAIDNSVLNALALYGFYDILSEHDINNLAQNLLKWDVVFAVDPFNAVQIIVN